MVRSVQPIYFDLGHGRLAEKSMFKDARIQGLFEGRREGKAEGKTEEKRNNIIRALRRGKLSADEIADDVDVSIDYGTGDSRRANQFITGC